MSKCESCGNDYDKTFEVTLGGNRHTFDCFECAINELAPECGTCGNKVIGHGVEVDGQTFCCANCARQQGSYDVKDRK